MIEKWLAQKIVENENILVKGVKDRDTRLLLTGKIDAYKEMLNELDLGGQTPEFFDIACKEAMDFWCIEVDEESVEQNCGTVWFKDISGQQYSMCPVKCEK